MKNAFFSGIQADTKKDSDDSDDEKKQDNQPVNDMNLLDFDAGPASNTGNEPATSGNLLDDMFSGPS